MMSDIGVGIIGCGNISAAYLRLGPMFKNLEIRAVADLNMDAAKARAEEFGVDARTVEELLASDDIGMIVNLTIPDAHYPITKRILEAGKHAYSEKPLVLTLEQGEDLRALSESKNLRVGSAPDTILGGSHQLARKSIDDGLVGKIIAGSCHVMSQGMESWHPNPDFFFLPGAGPVLDVGPYYVANLINLIGPVKRVGALTSSANDTRTIGSGDRKGETVPVKTPTNIHALLEFENGATITMSASWDIKSHRHANMELYGTEGTIYVPDPNFFGGDVEYALSDGEIKSVDTWDHPLGVPNQEHKNGMQANYRTAGLADMAAAIIEGRDHRCSLDRAVHAVDVMTSILKSGETGQFVDVKTTCSQPAPLGIEEAQALLK
ncbi:MAG: Gfo/Idh/MocA family oxidoreductase [OCS116 cluster bacterium]|nr:Gfo/Idh/MocA family oxidoreductase [OCS116 cluster bacterium]